MPLLLGLLSILLSCSCSLIIKICVYSYRLLPPASLPLPLPRPASLPRTGGDTSYQSGDPFYRNIFFCRFFVGQGTIFTGTIFPGDAFLGGTLFPTGPVDTKLHNEWAKSNIVYDEKNQISQCFDSWMFQKYYKPLERFFGIFGTSA